MTTTVAIVIVGLGLLVWLAVLIGTQLDTSAQRRARRRLAEERRRQWDERRGTTYVLRQCDRNGLCWECPYR